MRKKNIELRTLSLGDEYRVMTNSYNNLHCKLIKVTPKGYNLLNIETNKCVLYPHIYPSKYPQHQKDDGTMVFFIPSWVWISKIKVND